MCLGERYHLIMEHSTSNFIVLQRLKLKRKKNTTQSLLLNWRALCINILVHQVAFISPRNLIESKTHTHTIAFSSTGFQYHHNVKPLEKYFQTSWPFEIGFSTLVEQIKNHKKSQPTQSDFFFIIKQQIITETGFYELCRIDRKAQSKTKNK